MHEGGTTRSAAVEPSDKATVGEMPQPGLVPRKVTRRLLNGYFFVAPAILFLLLVSIFPLLRTLQMSMTDVDAGVLQFVGLQHYLELLQDQWFWNSLRNVVLFTAASVILHIAIGMGLALLLNETWFNTTVRNFMRGLLILPWVFSTAASGLMWTLLYHPFGLLNYLWVGVLGQDAPIEFLAKPGLAMGFGRGGQYLEVLSVSI